MNGKTNTILLKKIILKNYECECSLAYLQLLRAVNSNKSKHKNIRMSLWWQQAGLRNMGTWTQRNSEIELIEEQYFNCFKDN